MKEHIRDLAWNAEGRYLAGSKLAIFDFISMSWEGHEQQPDASERPPY